MNAVDIIFAVFVGLYAYRGFHRGIVREGIDLLGIGLGIAGALRFYTVPAALFRTLGMGSGWANVTGGGLLFLALVVGSTILASRTHRATGAIGEHLAVSMGGAAFASVWSTLFAIFMLVVLTVIPVPRGAQAAVRDSMIGRTVLQGDTPLYSILEDYAQHEARNLIFYMRQYFTQLEPQTQRSEAEEFFKLDPTNDIEVDASAERQILDLVNEERVKRGLNPVRLFTRMRSVARAHSADMYVRGYFAHVNPDGKDPFDRMADDRISFTYAGENLALAPTIALVHRGLMESPRHKDNILKREFTDLGVGVYRGPYGLMVTQNFCAGCTEEP